VLSSSPIMESEHIQRSIEAKIRAKLLAKPTLKKPTSQVYQEGYTDALMWVLDLFDFSQLDMQ
jgi:hypothetical protein